MTRGAADRSGIGLQLVLEPHGLGHRHRGTGVARCHGDVPVVHLLSGLFQIWLSAQLLHIISLKHAVAVVTGAVGRPGDRQQFHKRRIFLCQLTVSAGRTFQSLESFKSPVSFFQTLNFTCM